MAETIIEISKAVAWGAGAVILTGIAVMVCALTYAVLRPENSEKR